ncbi:hypothetical protein ACFC0K_15980 [Streptomyces hydrogenans]|uniref:hypothetical protein n=1 Tax=Streptomyces hydrogenans TaxID=1873719 RepID=UPI0035DCE465
MDHTERLIRLVEAVDAAVNEQHDKAKRLLAEIRAFSSTEDMFRVCCSLGELGRQLLYGIHRPTPGHMWVMQTPEPHGPCHPAHVFSTRFITAHANGDTTQCQALFDALLTADAQEFTTGFTCLFSDVVRLNRRASTSPHSA